MMPETMYVLITAAYNEEKYIEKTIVSVINQEILPVKWVIISDGSSDKTDEIIKSYALKYEFIQYLRSDKKKDKAQLFFSKVFALRKAYAELQAIKADFAGNLDADIVLPVHYYQSLLQKFTENRKLGVASGIFEEEINGKWVTHYPPEHQTPGALQVFRRECYDKIKGYPLLDGGEDAAADIMVRMDGWETRSFRDLIAKHLKPTGIKTTKSKLKFLFKLGKIDYFLGMHPLFALSKFFKRIFQKPYIIGGIALLWGFVLTSIRKPARNVPEEFIRFTRKEQLARLGGLLKSRF